MPGPTFTFGFIIATLLGAGFHLVFGGAAHRLALFLIVGWIGFAVGHIVGVLFEVNLFNVGSLRLLSALIGSFLLLIAANSLTTTKKTSRKSISRSR